MRKALIALTLVVAVLLTAEIAFVLNQHQKAQLSVPETTAPAAEEPTTEPSTVPQTSEQTEATTEETTVPETESETEETTTEPETEPTEPEPKEKRYVLTFAGDCTLGSDRKVYGQKYSFIDTIGEDYDYPFRNVAEYFKNDDFTFVNLEGVLADSGGHSGAAFTFRGPTAYSNILTGSSVEAVTLANNHCLDYGQAGLASTKQVLEEVGVTYVERDNWAMYTTQSGLTIGMYGISFTMNGPDMRDKIKMMRDKGAEIIVVAAHWGVEGSYRATADQAAFAHNAIDYGADIVYGSHPHVLQKIEIYKDKPIFYSMGNFCFGGNHWPKDLDTVILQQEVIRDENGKVRLGELKIIPTSCTSLPTGQNNFQPTPVDESSPVYNRILSKLDGTYSGGNLVVDYSKPTTPTTPPETVPPATVPPTTPTQPETPTEGPSVG